MSPHFSLFYPEIIKSYDDVYIISKVASEVKSRSEVDTTTYFCGINLSLPLIPSPMLDVVDLSTAPIYKECGLLSILPRFKNDKLSLIDYLSRERNFDDPLAGIAIGLDTSEEEIVKYIKFGVKRFCLDIANGFSTLVEPTFEMFSKLKKEFGDLYLITGNVADHKGYDYLAQQYLTYNLSGAIRVGIGGGHACSTKIETGIHLPTAMSIMDINLYSMLRHSTHQRIQLIADGGINKPADMCKAIALGADVVMAGSIFASCIDSCAKIDSSGHKIYRGSASFSVQSEYKDVSKINYVEGLNTSLLATDDIRNLINRYTNGYKSFLSYINLTKGLTHV